MEGRLRAALTGFTGSFRTNVALKPLTHLRIGGPARYFVEPYTETDVGLVVDACRRLEVPIRALGGGSNIVAADAGVPDLVLHLASLNRIVRDENRLTAGAGVSLPTLLRGARELGLAGLECLTGIPAMVGGATAMNAGTREGATFDHLVSLTVVEPTGELRVVPRDAMSPKYRDGGLGEAIVVQATFELEPDDPKAIFARFESYLKYRNATQPVTERSVGCVFRNPEGDAAGRMIEAAGCKLMRRGGLHVSAKHANYFVNDANGTSADFDALIEAVRTRVEREFGIELELEVRRWGD
jgi:UDP-N-acetylmuramate dehydrogenase